MNAGMLCRIAIGTIMVATTLAGCGGGGGSSGGGNNSGGSSGGSTPPPPTFTFKAASVVIGQADFDGKLPNRGVSPPSASTLDNPYGSPGYHNGILYLPDSDNNRILGFNAIPEVNDATADFVLGQADFETNTAGNSADLFDSPQSPSASDGQLFVADYFNNRVVVYKPIPATGTTATFALGQLNLNSNAEACSQTGMLAPESVFAVAGKLIVADSDNNRVLIWNDITSLDDGSPASLVLGQPDFTSCTANNDAATAPDVASSRTLNYPAGVWSDGTRLVVLDSYNNRALVWSSFPDTNYQPANLVLGQEDFEHVTANDDDQDGASDGAPTARTLSTPYNGVDSDGTRLFIADGDNNRVLVWNQFPTASFEPADEVIGQSSFILGAPNDDDQDGFPDGSVTGTPSARTLSDPNGVRILDSNTVIVGDRQNNRFLIFRKQ